MTNIEIRRKIIEIAYEKFKDHPYNRITPKELKNTLDISLKDLNYNIIYLEEKGYLELQKPLEGEVFVSARITTKGIDIVEDEYQFSILFPVVKAEIPTQINVYKEFEVVIDKIKSSGKIDSDLKEIIIEEVKGVQKELKKIEPSYSRIKFYLDKIRKRNVDISKQVMAIIRNPVITKILSKSAKKELEIT